MGDEIAKQPTYEERKAASKQHAQEVMGEATSVNFMAAAQDHTLADEYRDLMEWYTDTYDAAVIAHSMSDSTMSSTALQSIARQEVHNLHPEKWERLRELERVMHRQNLAHQNVVSAGHAAATEQKLEMEWIA